MGVCDGDPPGQPLPAPSADGVLEPLMFAVTDVGLIPLQTGVLGDSPWWADSPGWDVRGVGCSRRPWLRRKTSGLVRQEDSEEDGGRKDRAVGQWSPKLLAPSRRGCGGYEPSAQTQHVHLLDQHSVQLETPHPARHTSTGSTCSRALAVQPGLRRSLRL